MNTKLIHPSRILHKENHSMASSSSSSAGYMANYREGQAPPPCLCRDRPPAKLRESWSDNNPARRFFNCAKSLVRSGECGYFEWVDPELNQHYKNTILKMKLEIVDFNRNENIMKMEQRRANQKIIELKETVSYYESQRRHVEMLKLQEKVVELEELVVYCESQASVAKTNLLDLQVEHDKLKRKFKWWSRVAMVCLIAFVMILLLKK